MVCYALVYIKATSSIYQSYTKAIPSLYQVYELHLYLLIKHYVIGIIKKGYFRWVNIPTAN